MSKNLEEAIELILYCVRCMGKEMSRDRASQFVVDLIYYFSKNHRTLQYYEFKEYCELGSTGEYGKNFSFSAEAINGWIKAGSAGRGKKLNEDYMMANEKIGHMKRQFREMQREVGKEYCEHHYPTLFHLMNLDPPKDKRKKGYIGQLLEHGTI